MVTLKGGAAVFDAQTSVVGLPLYLAHMWLFLPALVLLVIYCALILWYRQAWLSLPLYKTDEALQPSVKVSVVVPARNESAAIGACIKSLLAQSYPASLLQIIIVDDDSDDDTAAIAESYAALHTHVQVLRLKTEPGMKSHKKRAIQAGITAAGGELIVATDADCHYPARWIETMASAYVQHEMVFVAAPVMYHTRPGLLSIFQTLDFISLQGITGASVHRRFHTMCNGANIAYGKKVFEEVNGFEGIDKLPTGDDMLLMYKIFRRYPNGIGWLKTRDTLVTTDPPQSWKAFFNQRIRWASKAAYYDDRRIFYVLLLVYFLNVSLLFTGIAAFFSAQYCAWWLVLIGLKTVVELSFMIPVASFFGKSVWLWFFPLMQPLHIVYTVIAGWLGRFGSYEWKGRTIVSS